MKSINVVLKLSFALMLVWLAYMAPTARADDQYPMGSYMCSSPFSSCYTQTTQEMGQCMGRCYSYGNDGTYDTLCYRLVETWTWLKDDYSIQSQEQTCNTVPSLGYNCASMCMANFEFEMGNCLNQFCTPVS